MGAAAVTGTGAPGAIAIARFRLTLAFLEKAGIRILAQSPRLPLNLAIPGSAPPPRGWEQTPARPHHFVPPKVSESEPDRGAGASSESDDRR